MALTWLMKKQQIFIQIENTHFYPTVREATPQLTDHFLSNSALSCILRPSHPHKLAPSLHAMLSILLTNSRPMATTPTGVCRLCLRGGTQGRGKCKLGLSGSSGQEVNITSVVQRRRRGLQPRVLVLWGAAQPMRYKVGTFVCI